MKRILVVDDDHHSREALAFLLGSSGYEVHEASDGVEALEYLERLTFDLVLLDQAMPRRTGLQVLETLRKTAHSTKVILVTAHDSDLVRIRAGDLRVDGFVVKPLNRTRLISLVEKTLAREPNGAHPTMEGGNWEVVP